MVKPVPSQPNFAMIVGAADAASFIVRHNALKAMDVRRHQTFFESKSKGRFSSTDIRESDKSHGAVEILLKQLWKMKENFEK